MCLRLRQKKKIIRYSGAEKSDTHVYKCIYMYICGYTKYTLVKPYI